MAMIEPYANPFLIGHETAEKMFLESWKAGNLPGSWLIGGEEGIGKATFAYRAARFLLAADENRKESYRSLELPETDPTFRLVANRSHPGVKILERDFIEADKKKVLKAIKEGEPMTDDQLQGLKKSSVIRIEEVRSTIEFLRKKSFDGTWRIVIIDSIDDLNTASANALLKILEEPPAKSLLFLISHNPSGLLPTIRSRCVKLNLQPLKEDMTASLLRRYAPNLSETEVKGLAQICGGRIGRALQYAENKALTVFRQIENLCYAGSNFNVTEALNLSGEAAKNEDLWYLVIELLARFVSDNLKGGQNIGELGKVWEKSLRMIRDQEALNMDKRQVLLLIISNIGKALAC